VLLLAALLAVVLSALALASVLSTALLPARPVVLTRWASLVPRDVLAGSVLGDRDLHRSLVSNGRRSAVLGRRCPGRTLCPTGAPSRMLGCCEICPGNIYLGNICLGNICLGNGLGCRRRGCR